MSLSSRVASTFSFLCLLPCSRSTFDVESYQTPVVVIIFFLFFPLLSPPSSSTCHPHSRSHYWSLLMSMSLSPLPSPLLHHNRTFQRLAAAANPISAAPIASFSPPVITATTNSSHTSLPSSLGNNCLSLPSRIASTFSLLCLLPCSRSTFAAESYWTPAAVIIFFLFFPLLSSPLSSACHPHGRSHYWSLLMSMPLSPLPSPLFHHNHAFQPSIAATNPISATPVAGISPPVVQLYKEQSPKDSSSFACNLMRRRLSTISGVESLPVSPPVSLPSRVASTFSLLCLLPCSRSTFAAESYRTPAAVIIFFLFFPLLSPPSSSACHPHSRSHYWSLLMSMSLSPLPSPLFHHNHAFQPSTAATNPTSAAPVAIISPPVVVG
ncbi:hypothetical protein BHM03_00049526 [Ensete ventricosum]|nr:hypothetical protein BHM03_00049526 [Ensete ventricosum]